MMARSNANIIPIHRRMTERELMKVEIEEATYDQAHSYEQVQVHFTPEELKRVAMQPIWQVLPWYKRLLAWLFA